MKRVLACKQKKQTRQARQGIRNPLEFFQPGVKEKLKGSQKWGELRIFITCRNIALPLPNPIRTRLQQLSTREKKTRKKIGGPEISQ